MPKGKIDKGEKPRQAAIRECEEECGITKLKITEKLPETYHIYPLKGRWVLKKTYWYKMISSHTKKLIPQKEEGITKVSWMGKKASAKIKSNTFPSVIDVLHNAGVE